MTLLDNLETVLLRWLYAVPAPEQQPYRRNSDLDKIMPNDFLSRIHAKTVIDFGCGAGDDAIEMAKCGAGRVIGIDIRDDLLRVAEVRAAQAGLRNVSFVTGTREFADVIVSVDSFEHFAEPAKILRIMSDLLLPNGEVLISFGPTWLHPLGGHLFSVFPWAHLILTERALIAWRSEFKSDGATRFGEVAGGLNQMTIQRFEALVAESPLELADLVLVPIKRLRLAHNILTREFTTSIVRCRLVRRAA